MGADEFFAKLTEKIEAMSDLDAQHPLTARLGVASLKRYLADDKSRIRLHDLVMGEADKVAGELFGNLGIDRRTPTLKQYEAAMQTLLALLAAGGYWGGPAHRKLWLRCFDKLVTPRSGPFPGLAVQLDYYPAYLGLHIHGIAALAGGRQGNLASVLANATSKLTNGDSYPLIYQLIMNLQGRDLEDAIKAEGSPFGRMNASCSRYVMTLLREPLREWIPKDDRYREMFYRFEYLFGLATSDLYEKRYEDGFRAILGLHPLDRTLPESFDREIDKHKEKWPFLRAGLFKGLSSG